MSVFDFKGCLRFPAQPLIEKRVILNANAPGVVFMAKPNPQTIFFRQFPVSCAAHDMMFFKVYC